ncbi:helix-turn-helix domain-containing protein [Pseudoalteromonas luteoviolacea]|uniref:helix-turn-helix domain-containing protein n=1 Tax=Pseudoalteromonas luteoviolacea TaxID=43657 RepID=UPI001F281886|nr:helix-turn-helix transcriptional regulator [Pseudoalteromonas luteoviolacea]MCF6442045.1 helix-turn-helix domain-containing protein [Pseudoalteromonas luteoviolacea]
MNLLASQVIRIARKRAGLTQAEAAEHYGVEERTLRRWENKESNPDFRDVVGVVEGLGQDFLDVCKEARGFNGN